MIACSPQNHVPLLLFVCRAVFSVFGARIVLDKYTDGTGQMTLILMYIVKIMTLNSIYQKVLATRYLLKKQ